MGYEDARRHLEPVRDHFEKNKILRISTSYVSTRKGEPSAIISLDTEFVGAYMLNDKLVVMMKFDDLKVDSLHVDIAYDAIRERTKKVLHNTFPGLAETDLAIHVVDCSGSLADMEFV